MHNRNLWINVVTPTPSGRGAGERTTPVTTLSLRAKRGNLFFIRRLGVAMKRGRLLSAQMRSFLYHTNLF